MVESHRKEEVTEQALRYFGPHANSCSSILKTMKPSTAIFVGLSSTKFNWALDYFDAYARA